MGNNAVEASSSRSEAGCSLAWGAGGGGEGEEGEGGLWLGFAPPHTPRPIEKEVYISKRSGNEYIGSESPRLSLGLGLTKSRFPDACPGFPGWKSGQKPVGSEHPGRQLRRRRGGGWSRRDAAGYVRVSGTGVKGEGLGLKGISAFKRAGFLTGFMQPSAI